MWDPCGWRDDEPPVRVYVDASGIPVSRCLVENSLDGRMDEWFVADGLEDLVLVGESEVDTVFKESHGGVRRGPNGGRVSDDE